MVVRIQEGSEGSDLGTDLIKIHYMLLYHSWGTAYHRDTYVSLFIET